MDSAGKKLKVILNNLRDRIVDEMNFDSSFRRQISTIHSLCRSMCLECTMDVNTRVRHEYVDVQYNLVCSIFDSYYRDELCRVSYERVLYLKYIHRVSNITRLRTSVQYSIRYVRARVEHVSRIACLRNVYRRCIECTTSEYRICVTDCRMILLYLKYVHRTEYYTYICSCMKYTTRAPVEHISSTARLQYAYRSYIESSR